MTALKVLTASFVAASVVVFVGLWVASVVQSSRFGRHVDGVLARLAGHVEVAPVAATGPALPDAMVTVSRLWPSTSPTPDPLPRVLQPAAHLAASPPAPPVLTTGNQPRQIPAMSDHHNTTRGTEMSISAFTHEDTTAGISLRWSLYQLTQQTERTGRELAASPHAAAVDPERARRALAHLAAGIAELDALAGDLDAAIGPGRGGAR